MPVYRILLEYDGSHFHGWQIQPGKPSVQEKIETAIETTCREKTPVVGSGRTDAGVHARGQVAHFALRRAIEPWRLQRALNGVSGPWVVVLEVKQVRDDFHARYDARLRRYHYYVATEPRALDRHIRWHLVPPPDFDAMNRAASQLVGTRDFDALCLVRSSTVNHTCDVRTARWIKEERQGDWYFAVEADRFLHGMVRAMVGTLLEIGHGRRDPNGIAELLASGDRRSAGPAAPAHGLVLEAVEYLDTE